MSFIKEELAKPLVDIKAYRPDIDGLKALSVLGVILFHYFKNIIPGGFVGVDVFFVISGYLIGLSTFNEVAHNKFSFAIYFGRRARRIFPSLTVMLAVLWVIGSIFLLADEFSLLGKHIGAASIFVSNWMLWREVGYFDLAAESKPLLNLWSLGVEEQYYLVFPLIAILGNKLGKKTLLTLCLLAISSLLLSQFKLADNASWAYYHPISRIWELLAGAILAHIQLYNSRNLTPLPQLVRDAFSLLGFVILFACFFLFTKSTKFPGIMAAFPVAAALLIIFFGESSYIGQKILSLRVLIYIGLISYPLYLWHWPVITLVKIIDGGEPPFWLNILCIAITFVLSAICYHFIERPLRFGRLSKTKNLPLWLWGLLLIIGLIGYTTYQTLKLIPEPNHKGISNSPASQTVILIGNSHAGILEKSLSQYLNKDGFTLEGFHQGGCIPFWNLSIHNPGHNPQDCAKDINEGITRALNSPNVKAVIIAALFENPNALYDITRSETDLVAKGAAPNTEHNWELFESALDITLKKLTAAHKTVVIIENVPILSFDPKECIPRIRISHETRSPCAIPRIEVENSQMRYRSIIKKVANKYPGTIIFDPLPAMCDHDQCFAAENDQIFYLDENHLSQAGVNRLSKHYNFSHFIK